MSYNPGQNYVIQKNLESIDRVSTFCAVQKYFNREVWLSRISLYYSDSPDILKICEQELRKWAGLQHTVLPQIIDAWAEENQLVFVTKAMTGTSLLDFVNQRFVPELEQAMQIGRDIASVMGYMHSHGFTHGALDLECFILEDDTWLRLRQTNFAMHIQQLFDRIKRLELPDENSDRQLRKSDLASWGAIMGALLTGDASFGYKRIGGKKVRVIELQTLSVRSKNPKVPAALEELILKSLAAGVDQESAIQSFEDIEQRLMELQKEPSPPSSGRRGNEAV
jgi:hypothetical protein